MDLGSVTSVTVEAKNEVASSTEVSSVELADIFRSLGSKFLDETKLTPRQKQAFRNIVECRTGAKGGHIWCCNTCRKSIHQYNSCLDRHCPKCQGKARAQWVAKRMDDILNVPYFHLVFTLPHHLNILIAFNTRLLDLLFKAAAQALLMFGQDPKFLGGELGILAVLHTWDQKLNRHYHLHCIVPGGALSVEKKEWLPCKTPTYLFPGKALGETFRRLYWHGTKPLEQSDSKEEKPITRQVKIKGLEDLLQEGLLELPGQLARFENPRQIAELEKQLYEKEWRIFIKSPFADSQQTIKGLGHYIHRHALSNDRIVGFSQEISLPTFEPSKRHLGQTIDFENPVHLIEYLGDNVERVAISNNRILDHKKGMVTFTYKDRKHGNRQKTLTISDRAFALRFLQHVLPTRFVKIRSYGFLANRYKKEKIARCRELLANMATETEASKAHDQIQTPCQDEMPFHAPEKKICPHCQKGTMEYLRPINPIFRIMIRTAIWDTS